MIRPPLLLGAIICALLLAGMAIRSGTYLALALPLMVYLLIALFFTPPVPQLHVSRQLSHHRTAPGDPVTVTLSLTNNGPALAELLIEDGCPPPLTLLDGETTRLTALAAGQTVTLKYCVTGQRGLHPFKAIRVTAREPLGLFEQQQTLAAPAQLLVLPPVEKVRRVAIRPPRTGIYTGLAPARQGGAGVEFFGVRPYRPGDPLRWVNERVSARLPHSLYVNEFEQERVVDVGLILDARRQSDVQVGPESLFEYSVQASATLADTFLDGGNRVGLFIYGRSLDWTFAGYGKVQRERILQALAQAQLGDGAVFERLNHLPTQLFPVRSQLVLVSPLLPDDAGMLVRLRARGYRLLVVSPDPVTFEVHHLPDSDAVRLATRLARLERNLTVRQLRQAGIRVIEWPVQQPLHQLMQTALGRMPGIRL